MRAVIAVLMQTFTRAKCGKIRLTCVDNDATFVDITREALALIEKHDARRYALLQKKLRFIDNTPTIRYASYDRTFRCCRINFAGLGFDWGNRAAPDYELHRVWYIAWYAAALVHEATHGRLFDLGIPYTRQTYRRVERICYRETQRFVARLPQTPYNLARDLFPPFDSSYWDGIWAMPRRERMAGEYRRAMELIWGKK